MQKISAKDVFVPLTVESRYKNTFIQNYLQLTHSTHNLFMVAGDQRVEHLITSFQGSNIDYDDLSPEHFFKICSKAKIGAFATQLGLISSYGLHYKNIPYVVKLNSISKVSKDGYGYSFSRKWFDVDYIYKLKQKSKLNILAIGYTVYVGIKEESKMFAEAADIIKNAHSLGFPVILWIYPKGKGVKNETDPVLISTCASIGSALGADFIKLNAPDDNKELKNLTSAVTAAGMSKIITAGGENIEPDEYISLISDELKMAKTNGVAVGRNVHQKSVPEAIKFCDSVFEIVVEGRPVADVIKRNYGSELS